MIAAMSLVVVVLFVVTFAVVAAMQQIADRRREREELADVVRALRQQRLRPQAQIAQERPPEAEVFGQDNRAAGRAVPAQRDGRGERGRDDMATPRRSRPGGSRRAA